LGYFNSIGGTALEVGSVKVNTLNLARIAYENNKENYLSVLDEKVKLNLKCLDVVRGIIRRNIDKGLLPNYKLEIMHMDSQYNTIGIIGIFEVLQKYGMTKKDEFGYTYYTEEGLEFAKEILAQIHKSKDEFWESIGKEYKINIEQVPAERAAVILMEKDKLFYPNETYDKPLYGNQWIPLAVKTTIQEKIKISAILDKACSGGSISHINLSAPFTNFDQAWDVLNMVADAGVIYFAFCTKISACKNNHGFYGDVCPVCGEKVYTKYNRIVGFLVPDVRYSKERKAEFAMRDWMDVLSNEHKAY
jgi:ribonucleoside-triphosphate reductase